MKCKRLLIRLTTTVGVAMLAACSGGGIDVSIGGNVSPVIPPLPDAQDSQPIVAHGEIDGLVGVSLNGVYYQAGSSTVAVNGNAGSLADLRYGQVITLWGRINEDGLTGKANSIRFDANVVGPVDGMDAGNRQLVALGQTVQTGAGTHFGGGIDPVSYAGLVVGDIVEISGHVDATGAIRATRVEPKSANAPQQVIGTVSDLDDSNLLFRINRLTVDYGDALMIELPGGAPANGMQVKAYGAMAGGRFAVERLVSAPVPGGSIGQRVQTAGIVTRFGSAADFDLDLFNIRANTATKYENGSVADLGLDAKLFVDGTLVSNNRIAADRITFGDPLVNTSRLAYEFDDFTAISVPSVFSITVNQGSQFSVEVFVDRGAENRIDVTQSGSKLNIALLPGDGNIRTLEAIVTMPLLEQIDLSGVASASLYDFDQANMTINVGGVSLLRGHGLKVENLTSNVTGVSRMDLVDIQPISSANIDISGVSQATLNMGAGGTISGSLSTGQGTGVSTLFYYGTKVQVDVTTDSNSSIVWLGDTRP